MRVRLSGTRQAARNVSEGAQFFKRLSNSGISTQFEMRRSKHVWILCICQTFAPAQNKSVVLCASVNRVLWNCKTPWHSRKFKSTLALLTLCWLLEIRTIPPVEMTVTWPSFRKHGETSPSQNALPVRAKTYLFHLRKLFMMCPVSYDLWQLCHEFQSGCPWHGGDSINI